MKLRALVSACATAVAVAALLLPAAPASAAGAERIAGADRWETSVRAAQAAFPGTADVVVIASGVNFPDALSAAPAAVKLGGPLLLTAPGALPASIATEIAREKPKKAVIVGGTAAVSGSVEARVRTLVPEVVRVAGADRFETSAAVNRYAFPTGADTAFIAAASNFPDALSASAAAASDGNPVLLVNGGGATIPSALLTQLGVTGAVIAGGTAVVSPAIESALRSFGLGVTRLAGADRYETSHAINRGIFSSSPTVYFAAGTNFPDALSGAALAGRTGSALYVVPGTCVSQTVVNDMSALGTNRRVLLGGGAVLSSAVGQLSVCPPPPAPPAPPAPGGPSVPPPPADVDCKDFHSQAEAQAWFNKYYRDYGDIARLDADNNGIACESLR